MRIEHKSFELDLKGIQEDEGGKVGIIRGYASTFGNIDLGGDVVDAGAFKKTLKESKGKVPILADHNPYKQIGWGTRGEEDDKGLAVEGEVDLENPDGKAKWNLAKKALEIGAKMGISIGYQTIKAEQDKTNPTIRRLKEIKLYEWSIVTFPMNTSAMVTAAKHFDGVLTQSEFAQAIRIKSRELGIPMNALFEEALRLHEAASEDEQDPVPNGDQSKIFASLQKLSGLMTI